MQRCFADGINYGEVLTLDTIKEFDTTKELVIKLMEQDERCRNDDKWLTYRVMRHFTKIYIPFEDFQKIPAFETIKRTRANIQNDEGRLLPTDPAVIEKRSKRQKEVRDWVRWQKE